MPDFGSVLNQTRLASSLAVSARAIGRYIDLVVDLLLDLTPGEIAGRPD